MGFLSDFFVAVDTMNKDAMREAVQLSTDDLCYKINKTNIIANPLIWTNCSEELARRAKGMRNSDLVDYYNEYNCYAEKSAAEVFAEELRNRGYDV